MEKDLTQRVEELEKMVQKLMKDRAAELFKGLGIGDEFELVGLKWKILDITDKGYMCLADKLERSMKLDDSHNNWEESSLRKYLNSVFLEELAIEVGGSNIIPFERNLISLDGQTEYGRCVDAVSLITMDEYRKYRRRIPNAGYAWWTCTPDSTKCNGDTRWLRVVSPSGNLNSSSCSDSSGVRPFCIFSSSLFESEE